MINFRGKGQTLVDLVDRSDLFRIPALLVVNFQAWQNDSESVIKQVLDAFGEKTLIVRSSAENEDSHLTSQAGKYLSVRDVRINRLSKAIGMVFDSYDVARETNEVIVQIQLVDASLSGVVFTHDQRSGLPYETYNWHSGKDTSYVTSGRGGNLWRRLPSHEMGSENVPIELITVLPMVKELNNLADGIPLDIEFAMTKSKDGSEICWLLQVRPLLVETSQVKTEDLKILLK